MKYLTNIEFLYNQYCFGTNDYYSYPDAYIKGKIDTLKN